MTQPWSNQAVSLLVIQAGTGFSGLFVYSPTPAAGDLIFSVTAVSGTDPYGNPFQQGATSYSSGSAPELGPYAQLLGPALQFNSNASGTKILHAGVIDLVDALAAGDPPATLLISPNTKALSAVGRAELGLFGTSADSTFPAQVVSDQITSWDPTAVHSQAEVWHAVTFQNGWSNSGTGPHMQYRLNAAPAQTVDLIGDMSAGTLASPTTIFTLPNTGYRPANVQACLPVASGGGAGLVVGTSRFVFNTDGTVTATGMAGFVAAGRLFLRYTMSLDA